MVTRMTRIFKAVLGEASCSDEAEIEIEPPSLIIKPYATVRLAVEGQFRRYRQDESKVDYLQNKWDQEENQW